MLLQHRRVLHVIQIRIHDYRVIEFHGDMPPLRRDLLFIPLPQRLLESRLGREDVIDRTVILRRPQFPLIRRPRIIQHLNLHPLIRRIPGQWRANANAVVGILRELKFKPQNKVAVLFFRVQVPAVVEGAINRSILDAIPLATLIQSFLSFAIHPSSEIFAVKERGKSLLHLRSHKAKRKQHHHRAHRHQPFHILLLVGPAVPDSPPRRTYSSQPLRYSLFKNASAALSPVVPFWTSHEIFRPDRYATFPSSTVSASAPEYWKL